MLKLYNYFKFVLINVIKCVCVFSTNVCVNTLTYVKGRCGEEDVCGLGDVCSMEAVMVRYVSMVMVLQGHHVSDKGVDWDAKRFQQLSLLRRREVYAGSTRRTPCPSTNTQTLSLFTWKMAYIMQLRGLLLEKSATLNMLKLHLSRSSNSWLKSRQDGKSVIKPSAKLT